MSRKTEQTELIQYIAAHPSMREEMAISRDDRKHLAVLTLEYPPEKEAKNCPNKKER